MRTPPSPRILLVDDNPAIHADLRRSLAPPESILDLDMQAAALFSTPLPGQPDEAISYELQSAFQGEEAYELVKQAETENRPYALAFVDMRMPPGWDGRKTITKLWEIDPTLHVVICTAFSDYSWEELQSALPLKDRWLILKKPFDKIEVLQLARVLTEKWKLIHDLNAHEARTLLMSPASS